jgi:hypothetical protein
VCGESVAWTPVTWPAADLRAPLDLWPADLAGEPCEMPAVPVVGTITRVPLRPDLAAAVAELYGDGNDAA